MLDLLDILLARVDAGEPVALCVLVRARGSTPQAAGAAMLVLSDGRTLGTLGGGCVEAEVRTRAMRALANGDADALATFKLDQDYGWDDGLMCGGTMDVSVQILRTPVDAEPLRAARDALRERRPVTYTFTLPDASGESHTFDVPLAPRPTLVVAGGGHVGQAIAALAATCDFDVTVVDDRADVVTAGRFPSAARIVGSIDVELSRLAIDAHTFVVIVTRGHRNDASALAAVIGSPAAYIGMIGSTRKVRTILGGLAEHGVARDRLLRVHAPVGLEIGAVTPGEIAVSVMAEVIAVRRACASPGEPLKIGRFEVERWLDRASLTPSPPTTGETGSSVQC